jgi:hypothetical protein
MKVLHLYRSHPRVILTAAAFGLALLGAVGMAHAFTIDDQSNTNANGTAKFSDPDSRFSNGSTGNNGQTTYNYGNTSLRLGSGSQRSTYDQRYNVDRMFDPNGRPGER